VRFCADACVSQLFRWLSLSTYSPSTRARLAAEGIVTNGAQRVGPQQLPRVTTDRGAARLATFDVLLAVIGSGAVGISQVAAWHAIDTSFPKDTLPSHLLNDTKLRSMCSDAAYHHAASPVPASKRLKRRMSSVAIVRCVYPTFRLGAFALEYLFGIFSCVLCFSTMVIL